MDRAEDVLQFWFRPLTPDDQEAMTRQLDWWFRGGADADIERRFRPLRSTPEELEYLARGEVVHQRQPPGQPG